MTKNNLNNTKFDAIVIGSGISGGWAAKELCENGLKTLVLERGRMVEHIKDYPTAEKEVWDFEFRNKPDTKNLAKQQKQNRTGYATNEESRHWFVDDLKHPYNEVKRFDWIRGYHVGGRSITWGRQALRLSNLEFTSNKREGIGIDWPIRYKDIDPWYTKVEKYIGVSGENLNMKHFPDQHLSPPFDLNCAEKELKKQLEIKYKDRRLTIGRFAHITGDKVHEGRSKCLYRNKCIRGCTLGGYFSSNSSTLPSAERTGNLTLKPDSIVTEIIYDPETQKASGVKVIDAINKKVTVYNAKVIFLCASTVASTSLLMQSKSERFPNGMGNDSGQLGHNLMDHHFKVGARAIVNGFENKTSNGSRPGSFHIPRFRNLGNVESKQNYKGGYSFQGSARRLDWRRALNNFSFGNKLKEEMTKPGPWKIEMTGYGEHLPYYENKITLDYKNKDEWGLPTVTFDCEFKENEKLMREDIKKEAVKMFKEAGFYNVEGFDEPSFPGNAIHEMGTARMGNDPKKSVLNKYNQIHAVKNVYVTDGSCMVSSGSQNPSLTYMALSARAANHAAKQIKEGKL
ncbi:MAG: GMC family oxidoreductase [Bacteroidota bacterium]